MRVHAHAILFNLFVISSSLAGGCGAGTPAPSADPTATPPQQATAGEAVAAEGAVAVELLCTEGVAERCDALDDDCDGVIDEGCGYGGGALAIVATWGSDANVDLVVTDGAGEAVPGLTTDHAGAGGCTDGDHPRIESATASRPLPGTVVVSLRHVDLCADDASGDDLPEGGQAADNTVGESEAEEAAPGATTASVTLALGGRVLGTFNVPLAPGATAPVVTLTLTP